MGGKIVPGPVGPFYKSQPMVRIEGLLVVEVLDLLRLLQPVKIHVVEGTPVGLIGMDKVEGRGSDLTFHS